MTYFITFLEGIITFISPCLLPMLPIYLSYFAGGNPDESQGTVLKNAVGFVGLHHSFRGYGGFCWLHRRPASAIPDGRQSRQRPAGHSLWFELSWSVQS